MNQSELQEQFTNQELYTILESVQHKQYHLDPDGLDYSGQYVNLHTIISKLLPLTYTKNVRTRGK